MASSNRVQFAIVEETTLGTTPNTPRMRRDRIDGEDLSFVPTFDDSIELRSDRMIGDPAQTGTQSGGTVNFSLIYPVPNSPLDSRIKSALYSTWVNTPSFDNDLVADSVITDAGTVANTYAVASGGAAVVVGHLVRATGFTNGANNQVFRAASSTATTIAGTALSLVAEAVPPGTARLKVVGFAGASADITATASGLASTALDFTTLGLFAGQWLKVGGTAVGDKFATAALNTWIRLTAIAAHALTCDHLPTGWTTDVGTGKTIKVWFGDQIKNGTTQLGRTMERGHLGQGTPTYIVQTGMIAAQLAMTFKAHAKITGVETCMGMGGSQSTAALSGSPDAAPAIASYPFWACSANVGRVTEGGLTLAGPNFVNALDFTINNNVTPVDAVDTMGPAGLTGQECTVTGNHTTYFGDNTLLTKLYAGTVSSISLRATKGSQAQIWMLPRVTYNGSSSPNATGKNVDVQLPLQFKASKDETTTNAQITWDRVEYFEA